MQVIKRNLSLVFIVLFFSALAACSGGAGGETVQDTIFLESGVKYVYISQGNGREVDSGSHVSTHINLMVEKDTVWSTHSEGEEIFEFDAKYTSLISGFDEVVMYAKEGDRILAIIPPELGYGTRGAGEDIPPNSTLFFDLEFVKVAEPKIFLRDVLFNKYQTAGVEAALAEYKLIKDDTANYNLSIGEWYSLHRKLMGEDQFEASVTFWESRLNERPDLRGYYYMAIAYDSLGNTKQAIKTLESGLLSGADTTNSGVLKGYIEKLKSR